MKTGRCTEKLFANFGEYHTWLKLTFLHVPSIILNGLRYDIAHLI